MKVLPIVGRELREGSRRGSTYWLRARVAFQAVVVGIIAYFYNLLNPTLKLGTILFWGLSGIAMLFCLLAGRRSTADCLSQEKRDGTLGLLFLTDLKGYDVVLGKMAATSVTGLYALLAVFPVLGVPLLTGGMTSAEVERMIVVLTNTFFFSIAIGIFASAVSREYRAAMATNFLLWLGIVGAPTACGVGLAIARNSKTPPLPLFYSCPVFSFFFSADPNYITAPRDFWLSIIFTQVIAWGLTLLACRIVPRTWGDKPPPAKKPRWRWRDFDVAISYGNVEKRIAFRRQALNRNAYFWHAARARLKAVHVWAFVVLAGMWWIYCWLKNGRIWLDETTYLATAAIVNSTFKLWITVEAGQKLGEDRRAGGFELLLATPMTVSDILRGQWMALRRQFLKPLLVAVLVEAIFIVTLNRQHKFEGTMIAALLLVLPCDILALAWVAMSSALTAKSQTKATISAVARILVLPWAIYGLLQAATDAYYWLALQPFANNDRTELTQWLIISLGVDLFYGLQAWRTLRRDFRLMATQTISRAPLKEKLKQSIAAFSALAGRVVPQRARMPVAALIVVGLGLWGIHAIRPKYIDLPRARSPVIVSITQSNAPLQVFRGGVWGVFMVLSDGSLWRWGESSNPTDTREAMPTQAGTDHDWLKVVADGSCCMGLRGNGKIYTLTPSLETSEIAIQQTVEGSNWIDVATSSQQTIGLKRDGSIWSWFAYGQNSHEPVRIGNASNWTGIACRNEAYLGVQANGTLWAWGRIVGNLTGYNSLTNLDAPTLLCADTDWVSIDSNGEARNRDGELWYAIDMLPIPYAGVASVCRPVTTNLVFYRTDTSPFRMSCQIRTNGTLWASPIWPGRSSLVPPASSSTTGKQIGSRSDWVALWGMNGTVVGTTADGLVWAWGLDLGRKPVAVTRSRVQTVKALLDGQAMGGTGPGVQGRTRPILEEPLPLMKVVSGAAK